MHTSIHFRVSFGAISTIVLILASGFGVPIGQAAGAAEPDSALYDVPYLKGVLIDGDPADWKDRGFRVDLMPDRDGRTQPKSSLDPSFRLGWDERGLLVLVTVCCDDVFVESPDESALADKDSVEVFASAERGSKDLYELVVSPGVAPEFPQLRAKLQDLRKTEPRPELAYEAVRTKSPGGPGRPGGYVIEMLLPWTNLNVTPKEGIEVGFQLLINDADGPKGRFQAAWYPDPGTKDNPKAMNRIRLARKPSPPDRARIRGEYDDTARTHVSVLAVGELAGKNVRVKQGWHVRASGDLEPAGDYARAELRWPLPAVRSAASRGEPAKPWRVRIPGVIELPLELPNPDIARGQRVMLLSMAAKPPVFKGKFFPACDFDNPLLAEQLIGPYRIEPTLYDRAFNKVMTADEPGRYGVILEILPQSGGAFRRYLTLFRAPDSFDTLFTWWCLDPRLTVRLPGTSGIDPSVVGAESESFGAYFKGKVLDDLAKGQEAAVLFAGLFEAKPGQPPVTVSDDVWAADRQWWVELKRKFNGMDKTYPNALVCPYQKEGDSAPVVREGTPKDAGMKPDAAEKIDAVCRAWVEESNEPFAVCVVRHGVVLIHKAYGTRDGEPMTVDTKSWMASISKFLSGSLMMMLVDQKRVDLDAPVDQYLPALRGIPVKYPLTIRHLYTHTGGLGLGLQATRIFVDHWGDERNDFDEIVAGYYPYLEVGARHAYNGAGHALGGKIIESVTGEALPQFFRRHLWGPLGCDHTDAMDGSARTMSVPLDIARFGQLMLNRGAYGNMRFFSEATFEKMLPVKLAPYVHFDTEMEWGIGPVWTREQGLSKRTFGHGAASAATLRIDPDNDLVIVMTRNTTGPQYGKYHPQFIQAIVEGMESP